MKPSGRENQEPAALLKLLALSNKDVEAGKIRPIGEGFAGISERMKI
jgi:hypothetical protein